MKLIAMALAALAVGLAPAAWAKDAPKDAGPDKKSHETGMAEAPALIQQAGAPCTVTDAAFLGTSEAKDEKTGAKTTTKVYEAVCQEGLGRMILATTGQKPQTFDCIALTQNAPKPGDESKKSGGLYCRLPANADSYKALQPLMTKAGAQCGVNKASWLGVSEKDLFDQYEVVCAEGPVYILQSPQPASSHALAAINCAILPENTCPSFTKEAMIASVKAMAAPANKPCEITAAKYIGEAASTHHSYYEIACMDEKAGFVLETAAGKYVSAIDCTKARVMGMSCSLSSAVAAETDDITTYNGLAKQVGYPCQVKAYHRFGLDPKTNREVVELSCSDHPDGVVALLPIEKGQTATVMNCIRAGGFSLACTLTPKEATFAKLTQEMASKSKTCTVKDARSVGSTADGDDVIEVSCAETQGSMIEYGPGIEQVKSVTACTQAKEMGGGCKLAQH